MWLKEEPFTPQETNQEISDQFLVEDFRSKIAKSKMKMKCRNIHKEFKNLNLHIKITQTVTIQ